MAKVSMNDVKIGWGVERGFNGDCYPYYIVDIERGKYSYNKDKIVGLWIVPADATCEDYYNSKWNVESFDPAKHTKEKAFYIKTTRKDPTHFSTDGVYNGAWDYIICEKPHRSENPHF